MQEFTCQIHHLRCWSDSRRVLEPLQFIQCTIRKLEVGHLSGTFWRRELGNEWIDAYRFWAQPYLKWWVFAWGILASLALIQVKLAWQTVILWSLCPFWHVVMWILLLQRPQLTCLILSFNSLQVHGLVSWSIIPFWTDRQSWRIHAWIDFLDVYFGTVSTATDWVQDFVLNNGRIYFI